MADSFSFNRVHAYYEQPLVVDSYARNQALFPAELNLFEAYPHAIDQCDLLDIGVGPGRTTSYLYPKAANYIGIDYSKEMIRRCKKNFKQLDFRFGDARQLDFESNRFDTVVFSFNGIDSVNHADRLSILKEVHRVLKVGGHFIFSSHNLDCPRRSAYDYEGIYWHPNPITFLKENLKDIKKYFRNIRNHRKNKDLEVYESGYALINDQVNSYALLVYYIDKNYQCEQLTQQGFDHIRMMDGQGQWLSGDQDCLDPWIYYIAQKTQ